MADELVDLSSQFKGLPMGDLIGSPLTAACEAQVKLAQATADFIKVIGFMPPAANDPNGVGATRTAQFRFKRPVDDPTNAGGIAEEDVELEVPLLAIVKVPNLSVTKVDITFDMEVKSSFKEDSSDDKKGEFAGDATVGWGPFSMHVHVGGSVSTHQEQTRSSDSSAKYHVEVKAEDSGMPEGLARVLDFMHSAITPTITKGAAMDAPKVAIPAGGQEPAGQTT